MSSHPALVSCAFISRSWTFPALPGVGGFWECVSLQSFSTTGTTHLVATYLLWVYDQILIAWSSLGWDHGGDLAGAVLPCGSQTCSPGLG